MPKTNLADIEAIRYEAQTSAPGNPASGYWLV